MKVKKILLGLLSFICVGFSAVTVTSCGSTSSNSSNEEKVYDHNDVIAELKTFDNTSPYEYSYETNNDGERSCWSFSYNESIKKFTSIYYFSYLNENNVLWVSSVNITWIWGYLSDAKISSFYSCSDYNLGGGVVELEITDITFGLFPNVKDFDYELTYSSASESTTFTATSFARTAISQTLNFANDFCTSIDGSLSIR